MVLDTSALLAVLFGEPEATDHVRAITRASRRLVSSATVAECSLVVEARRGEAAGRELDLFLHRAQVVVVPVDEEQAKVARAAWRRYGKGHHRAALNYGDLFSYALARVTGDELLYKGTDFAHTDAVPAVP